MRGQWTTLLLFIIGINFGLAAASKAILSSGGCSNHGMELDKSNHIWRDVNGRKYWLHVPKEYEKGKAHPLIINYHGVGGTGRGQERITQFSAPNLTIGGMPYIAAYPQGVPNIDKHRHKYGSAWEDAPYANRSVNDIDFTKDLLRDITEHYCVDPLRIYAIGKSNGAGFANLLACHKDTSQIFAAVAVAIPALYRGSPAVEECTPARPVPIISAHGTRDPVAPYKGRKSDGTGRVHGHGLLSIPKWRTQWAQTNGCDEERAAEAHEVTIMHEKVEKSVWRCKADVEAYTMNGFRHVWPSQALIPGFDFRSIILEFFTANPMREWHPE